nr:hypothetical protein [Streptococcus pneumoniae]
MRYQTHYQLKQKLWLDPFGNRQAIGGLEAVNRLISISLSNPASILF